MEREIKQLEKRLADAGKEKSMETKRLEYPQAPKTWQDQRRFLKGRALDLQASSKKESVPDSSDSLDKMKSISMTFSYYEDAFETSSRSQCKVLVRDLP